ncbi:MAG TPA: hypothetical protein EYN64_05170 [Flavobacteriales bacterium]|nr:hypothetical protein [Flavobacteriales bacterium]
MAAQPYQWGWPNAGAVNQTCIGLCPDYQLQFQEDELGSGLFDPLTSIITINESGLYQLGLQAEFTGNGHIEGMLSIRVNGLSVSESNYTDNSWSLRRRGVVSDLHRLEVGDQIEYHTLVYVGQAAALSTLVTSGLRTFAFGNKVAP